MMDNNTNSPLDAVDQRLLALLQDDAARSNQALADAAHVSAATALRRVRRLVEAGVIERQVAIVSPQAFGTGLTAIVEVTLDRQGVEHVDAFEARALAEPAVQRDLPVAPHAELERRVEAGPVERLGPAPDALDGLRGAVELARRRLVAAHADRVEIPREAADGLEPACRAEHEIEPIHAPKVINPRARSTDS